MTKWLILLSFAAALSILLMYVDALKSPDASRQIGWGNVVSFGLPASLLLSAIAGVVALFQTKALKWLLVPIGAAAFFFLSRLFLVLSVVSH